MISSTPIVRPRETSGAHRIERVSNWVRVSTRGVKRGSRAGVIHDRGLPGLGHPAATPSPIFRRKAETSRPFAPSAASNTSSCFSSFDHQQRPGLGGDELPDLLDDELDDLARLQDGVGGLHHVGEDGEAPGRWSPARAPRDPRPRRRGVRLPEVGEDGRRGWSGRPQASTTKSRPRRSAWRRTLAAGPPRGRPRGGSRARAPGRPTAVARVRRQRDQRAGEARRVEGRAGHGPRGGQELVLELARRTPQAAPQRGARPAPAGRGTPAIRVTRATFSSRP